MPYWHAVPVYVALVALPACVNFSGSSDLCIPPLQGRLQFDNELMLMTKANSPREAVPGTKGPIRRLCAFLEQGDAWTAKQESELAHACDNITTRSVALRR